MVVEILLRLFKGWSALKVTVTHRAGKCPVHKENDCRACDELKDDFSIISNKKIIETKGKDTARFKEAGVKRCFGLNQGRKLLGGLERSYSLVQKGKRLNY